MIATRTYPITVIALVVAGRLAAAQSPASSVVMRGHTNGITGVSVSGASPLIATSSLDGTVRTWNVAAGRSVGVFRPHRGEVFAVALSPDGTRIASAGSDSRIRIIDARTGVANFTAQVEHGWCAALSWSPDGRHLAAGCSDATARIWDTRSGALSQKIARAGGLNAIAWSPDGRALATPAGTWDVASGKQLTTFTGHTAPVRALCYSRDGATVATASMDKTVRLWDARTGAPERTFAPVGLAVMTDTGWVMSTSSDMTLPQTAVAFSPDNAWIATGGADRVIRIWNAATGALAGALVGHTMTVMGIAFTDPTHLVSVSLDGTVRAWDVAGYMRAGQP